MKVKEPGCVSVYIHSVCTCTVRGHIHGIDEN